LSTKRRDKGEGSLFFREDEQRWVARFKGADGKQHAISVSVGSLTKAEAKRKAKLKLEEAKHRTTETGQPTSQQLSQYLASWLKGKARKLRRNTAANWKRLIAAYINPALGKYQLRKLSREQVKAWLDTMCDEGDLEASSIHTIYEILDLALKEAVEHEILERSPCYKIALPRIEEREMSVLDASQAKAFLAHLAKEGHTHEALFKLLLYTGMRLGEARALRWTDINLERMEVEIQRTLCYVRHEGYFENEPKTKNSRRTLILANVVVEALKEHHKRQLLHITRRYKDGASWEDKNLVFPGPSGNYRAESGIEQSLTRLLERAGLPRIRVHDLRHTAATLALKSGINIKSVSLMLGHSDIQITMRRYIHILPDMRQEDIEKLSKLLA
jgi:integrase